MMKKNKIPEIKLENGRYYWVRFKKFVRNDPVKGQTFNTQVFENDPKARVTIGIYNRYKEKPNEYPWETIGSDEIYKEEVIEVIRPVIDRLKEVKE